MANLVYLKIIYDGRGGPTKSGALGSCPVCPVLSSALVVTVDVTSTGAGHGAVQSGAGQRGTDETRQHVTTRQSDTQREGDDLLLFRCCRKKR